MTNLSPSQMAEALYSLAAATELGFPASAYYVSGDGVTLLVTPIEFARWSERYPDGRISGVPLTFRQITSLLDVAS